MKNGGGITYELRKELPWAGAELAGSLRIS